MMNMLERLRNWYEELAAPRFSDWEQQVFEWQHPWLILIDMSGLKIKLLCSWDLRTTERIERKSVFVPWKKYYFVRLPRKKSSYTLLFSSPVLADDHTGVVLSGNEIGIKIADTLNGSFETPWFPPGGDLSRGLLPQGS